VLQALGDSPVGAATVDDTGAARTFLGEQVEVIVEQVHFEGGLVDRAGRHSERLAPDDTPFIRRTGKVAGPVRGLGYVPPLSRVCRG